MHPQYIRAPSKNLAQHLWLLNHKKEREGGKREREGEKKKKKEKEERRKAKASRANHGGLNVSLKSTNYKSKKRRRKKEKKKKRCSNASAPPLQSHSERVVLAGSCFCRGREPSPSPSLPPLPQRSLPAAASLRRHGRTERFQMFQLRRRRAAPRAPLCQPPGRPLARKV